MRKRIVTLLLALIVMVPLLAVPAHADMGPKPGTTITVQGGGEERMVLTLLGEDDRWGPNAFIGHGEYPSDWMVDNELQEEGWYAFRDYEDPDGFYFWGQVWEDGVNWDYYPPEVFKVAVYYPDYDLLWVSADTYERYAFQSAYRLILPAVGEGAVSGEVEMVLKQEGSIAGELAGLAVRIVLTIAIELAVAWLFDFDGRRQRRLILRVNLLTQVGLNALLMAWYYFDGPLTAMLRLILAELAVLTVESIVYLRRLREGESAGRTVLYTLCANAASVLLGFLLLS